MVTAHMDNLRLQKSKEHLEPDLIPSDIYYLLTEREKGLLNFCNPRTPKPKAGTKIRTSRLQKPKGKRTNPRHQPLEHLQRILKDGRRLQKERCT